MNDVLRFVFLGLLLYSLLMLWTQWQKWPPNNPDAPTAIAPSASPAPANSSGSGGGQTGDDDAPPTPTQQLRAADNTVSETAPADSSGNGGGAVAVATDWLEAAIGLRGGNLVSLRLKKHLDESGAPLAFLENGARRYVAQSGLVGGDDFPNHRSDYQLVGSPILTLAEGGDSLTVELESQGGGVRLVKRYIFNRGDYLIRLELEAHNAGDAPLSPQGYFQLAHSGALPEGESTFLPSFFGAAVFTDAGKFNKIAFEDIGDDDYQRKSEDGWIGLIQRYFAAVWLPENSVREREYYMRKSGGGGARAGLIAPLGEVAPGASSSLAMRLFAGAQEQTILNQLNESGVAPNVHLVVDYGWLTVIAVPLFKLLAWIQNYAENWGLSIIFLTFLIKLAFYPLSSISYRSIARMKELAPRIKNLQEIHKDDKQKMQQAMMKMYREQKVNPFGGCLPVLLQIPVFIALYWVILGSVELRMAPFYFWIEDLSAADPYFVLPLLMGAAMFLQTRMSPAPPDPTQAMILKMMPLFFCAFSLFFPAGLVLYWLLNTLLSIAQQWHIARSFVKAKSGGGGGRGKK